MHNGALNDGRLRGVFEASFRQNYPYLVHGRNLVIVDCTQFNDPDHRTDLRKHRGTHPDIIDGVVNNDRFPSVMAPCKQVCAETDARFIVIFVCKSGRHRSVACRSVFDTYISRLLTDRHGTNPVSSYDLAKTTHWQHLCQNCRQCDWPGSRVSKQVEQIFENMGKSTAKGKRREEESTEDQGK